VFSLNNSFCGAAARPGRAAMASAPAAAAAAPPDVWLQAFHDPVAGLRVFGQSLRLVDLGGDGDFRLLAADLDRKLKVFRGTGVSSVHPLLDQPVAAAVFYPDAAAPRTPAVAVAAGPVVYIYRNLRPYLKFTLPQVPLSEAELEAAAAFGAAAAAAAAAGAGAGAGAGAAAPAAPAAPAAAPRTHKPTVVTCMDVINRDREGETEPSSLVVGTEAAQLLFLDASGAAVERAPVELPSVPALIVVHGTLKGEHRISIACRDGVVYAVKDRELTATRIEPPALPVAIARTEALLYVASLDGAVTAFHPKGKKAFTLPMPAAVTAMARMLVRREKTADCVAVALEGGEVRVYNGAAVVARLQMADTVVAMRFGQYGREANTLVLVSRAGSLTFKMLKRTASFEPPAGAAGAGAAAGASASGPPPEQDVPLAVPKKTRLYLELAQREREASGDIYRVFQRDLVKLRLLTARAYAKVLRDGLSVGDGGAAASLSVRTSGAGSAAAAAPPAAAAPVQLRISCAVRGLGPRFKISVDLMQSAQAGAQPLFNVSVALVYSPAFYHMERPLLVLPLMLPGVHYFPQFDITCVDPLGAADVVRAVVSVGAGGGHPGVTAQIAMPLSSI